MNTNADPHGRDSRAGTGGVARALRSARFLLPALLVALGLGVFTLSLLVAVSRATRAARATRGEILQRALAVDADLLAAVERSGGAGALPAAIAGLDSLPGLTAALLVGPDGRVRVSVPARWTGASLAETPWAAARALVSRARSGVRTGHLDRPADLQWVAVALPGAAGTAGDVLFAELDCSPLVRYVWRETSWFFVAIGITLAAGLSLAGLFLRRRVVRPARRIADAADRFAAGDRAARTGLGSDDELGLAGQAFDRMALEVARAEHEVRRERLLVDGLLHALPVGVLMVDRATLQVLYTNARMRALAGLGLEPGTRIDLLGNRVESSAGVLIDDPERPLRTALRTGQPVEARDLQLVRPDGGRVPVVVTARPVRIAPGPEPDAAVAVFQDRRELDQAFAELRRSERRFSALLDSLPVGVLMVDRASRTVLFANRRLEELAGVPTPAGRPIGSVDGGRETEAGTPYPFEDLPIERVLREGRMVESDDLVYVQPDGTRVPVVTTARPMSLSGGPDFDAVVAVVQDRREIERATAEIRDWEERYQSALRATGQTVYEWDVAEDRIRFSDSLEAVFGYAPEALPSNAVWNTVTHPDDLPGVIAEMAACRASRRMFEHVYRLRHRDGRWRWVRDRGLLRFDSAGNWVSMIGAVDDVTEQRELETRFRQAQKMETVGTLAGGIAHDFNNQLTGVLGHLDLLREELAGDDERLEHVRIAHVAAERCAELTRGLLAFSRMLRGEPRPVDVNAMLGEAVALLRRVLPSTIGVELAPAGPLGPALVDPTQLQQVILNLCINARDAMPDGGRLRISTASVRVEPGTPPAAHAEPGEYVRIAVVDEGTGIAPDVLPRIFEPFFTTKPVGAGTGLGLAMVYGIVTQHRGWVDVESAPGKGASFRVHLPVAPAGTAVAPPETSAAPSPPAAAAGAGDAPVADAGRCVVLVVDDEPMVLGFASRLLERAGCRVIQAGDGREALDRWATHRGALDAVLLDLTMPGPPVREVVRELRRSDPGLRIVLTSGYAQDAAAVEEYAGLPFLAKPYTSEHLLAALVPARPPAP